MKINGIEVEGTVQKLKNCPAWTGKGAPVHISGNYLVIEYHPYEPSAYVYEAGWEVIEPDAPDDAEPYFVAGYDLWAQVDPEGYADFQQSELEMERLCEECAAHLDNVS